MRIGRIEYFMEIAKIVAKRSTCKRAQVGAILIEPDSNRIVATGYNGSPSGSPHCIDVGCLLIDNHCIRTIHAELNAILHLEHRYSELTLVSTHQPCYNCTKSLIVANVKKIIYEEPYFDEAREMFLKEQRLFSVQYKGCLREGKNEV